MFKAYSILVALNKLGIKLLLKTFLFMSWKEDAQVRIEFFNEKIRYTVAEVEYLSCL